MNKYKIGAALFILSLILIRPAVASAQHYVFEKGLNNSYTSAQDVTNPGELQYVYGILSAQPEVIDYYALQFSDYTPQVKIELLVPKKDVFKYFHPQLIFIDPTSSRVEGNLPFGFPNGAGGRVFDWVIEQTATETDPNVLETFWVGPGLIKDMASNRYVVAVYDPAGGGGRYALKIGAQKRSDTWKDKLNTLVALIRIKLSIY